MRQALTTIISYTYMVSDGDFLRGSLQKLEKQLQQFREHANHRTTTNAFPSWPMANITARLQRRKLAVIHGTKRSRRLKQRRNIAGNLVSQSVAD